MLLTISQDHRNHLEYLINSEDDIVENFALISVEFLKNGINRKTFSTAAQKLNESVDTIENAVQGLMQLFTEGTKFNLDETDFHDSLLLIGFSENICKILTELYLNHYKYTKGILSKTMPSLPVYRNLSWRFDIKIASRALHNQITPIIYLKISTFDGKEQKDYMLQTDVVNLVHMTKTLEEALNEMKSNHCRRILRNIK
ncbi:COMM domain-containing protein 2-like [Styela clava]|uniref:COMM domain-containing protein 2-like n=1 Tax=Styela clava TaxID=7725 RepID=UPI00193A276E|nr:COMM domain-containing protein 2-like [Styela clava]XP_039262539.1 COMM domain-containing protein 2-like [Styela clava]